MMRGLVVVAAVVAAVSGCGGSDAAPGGEASVAAVQVPVAKKSVSKAEWDAALAKVVTFEQTESTDDGQSAGFASISGSSVVKSDYSRDVFRKLRHFGTRVAEFEDGVPGPAITCYVALLDYDMPDFFVSVKYRADEWLFMDKAAVMVGDQLVLDLELPLKSSDRNVVNGGILERYDKILRRENLDGFRKAVAAESAMARLSGSKGYASIGKKDFRRYRDTYYQRCLKVYDALAAALPGTVEGS